MRVKTYDVLQQAISDGIMYGWNRAHKHTDDPDESHIQDQILQAILLEIDQVFTFDDFKEEVIPNGHSGTDE
jgi:hypothetical protein